MLGSVQNRMGLAAVQGDPAPCALGKGGGNSDCVQYTANLQAEHLRAPAV